MKTCTKCILPETYPGIFFDDEGVCNFCREYQPNPAPFGKDKLIEVLGKHKKKGKYDCVVPNSGGKDSSYILYYIVRELGLNPIVVSYNSGFQTEVAEQNVTNACEILGVDLEIIRSPGEIQRKLLKSSYLVSEKINRPWGCANCPAVLRMVSIQNAQKYNVPYIIWGSSKVENVKSAGDDHKLSDAIKKGIMDPSIEYHGIRYVFYRILQRIRLKFPLRLALNPFKTPEFTEENPEFIPFYEYIQWDSMENTKLLKDELGWQHPPGRESRFDCSLHTLGNKYFYEQYGITQDGVNFCNFIREGKMNREDAIIKEREIIDSLEDEYQELMEKIL
jgi:hypothetical protein